GPAKDEGPIQEYAFDPGAPALRPTRTIPSPNQGGPVIVYNPAGDRFARLSNWDGMVYLFDAVSGQLLFSTPSNLSWFYYPHMHFDRSGLRLSGALAGERNDRLGLWSIADGREYQALIHPGENNESHHISVPAIHPSGRMAALGFKNGVALFDLES